VHSQWQWPAACNAPLQHDVCSEVAWLPGVQGGGSRTMSALVKPGKGAGRAQPPAPCHCPAAPPGCAMLVHQRLPVLSTPGGRVGVLQCARRCKQARGGCRMPHMLRHAWSMSIQVCGHRLI
jgi:hypothetical protein